MSLSRYDAARLTEEVMRRTRFVLGTPPEDLELRLFHRLMEMDLDKALDGVRQWACAEGYMLNVWWMEAVMELDHELRLEDEFRLVRHVWRWASDPPTTPVQVLATDGDGAYWVAVYDSELDRAGMTREELDSSGLGWGTWVDAHSEEVLEVAAWRELPRWDSAELPRQAAVRSGCSPMEGV